MSEQRTGATDDQIEAAVERRWPPDLIRKRPGLMDDVVIAKTRFAHAARYLVPLDHRIVSVSDLRRLCALACVDFEDEQDRAFLARMVALIDGTTDRAS